MEYSSKVNVMKDSLIHLKVITILWLLLTTNLVIQHVKPAQDHCLLIVLLVKVIDFWIQTYPVLNAKVVVFHVKNLNLISVLEAVYLYTSIINPNAYTTAQKISIRIKQTWLAYHVLLVVKFVMMELH